MTEEFCAWSLVLLPLLWALSLLIATVVHVAG